MTVVEPILGAVGAGTPAWTELKDAVSALRLLQLRDGSLAEEADRSSASGLIARIRGALDQLAPAFPADEAYLAAVDRDLADWAGSGFGVPDFARSLAAFQPQRSREDGLRHLVLFPMTTQNGSPDRLLEALLVDVAWPDFVDRLERETYGNALFVPLRFVDFTGGYDTNSAVLFPQTGALQGPGPAPWGGNFPHPEAGPLRRGGPGAPE